MNTALAIEQGITLFPRTISAPGISHKGNTTTVLKPSSNNRKLGPTVWQKGMFKGKPLFSLTLEERATCDHACNLWDVCYGNNMPFATRFQHGPELEETIANEVEDLTRRYPNGISVRLHILGDFYSCEYVRFWEFLLSTYPNLDVYGYTHRTGEIKQEIDRVWLKYKHRFNILQSGGGPEDIRPIAAVVGYEKVGTLPICPVETKKVSSCLACGLCTNPNIKGVAFIEH
jgi:hypothetical protein